MRKLITICVIAAVVLIAGSVRATTIRDNPGYVASTGLTLGPAGSEWGGETGFTITEAFQINLEYQSGILNYDIDNFNAYDPSGNWDLNFSDNDEYVLKIDANGGLSTWAYPDTTQSDSGNANIQWTLTGWHQTILAGDIVDNGDGTITLRVLPAGIYRPFVNEPPVNDVEIFDGNLDCEVLGYTFDGAVYEIGDGSELGVILVPEPATICLLGLGGLSLLRKRRA